MGVFTATMTTHKRTDITSQFPSIRLCKTHGIKPVILELVVGKRRQTYFTAVCKCDTCGKISDTSQGVVEAWNYWNTE